MGYKLIVRILSLVFACASSLALNLIAQEPPAPSVAEAARRTREQKEQKKDTTKPTPVITNDTLSPSSAATATNPSAGSATPSASDASSTAAKDSTAQSEEEVERKAKLEALKRQIADSQNEVDLAQRQLALDQDAYLSKTNYANDKDVKAKLDAEQAELKDRQDELARLKAEFSSLGGVEEPKPVRAPIPAPGSIPARP